MHYLDCLLAALLIQGQSCKGRGGDDAICSSNRAFSLDFTFRQIVQKIAKVCRWANGEGRGEGGSAKTKNANLSRGLKMVTHNLTMAKRCLFRKNSNRWEWLDPTHPPQGFRTSKVNLKHFTFFMKKTN